MSAKDQVGKRCLSSSQEVFDYFSSLAEHRKHQPEAVIFAYGWFSYDKFEWINHERNLGKTVTHQDLENWIKSKPIDSLERTYDEAFDVLYSVSESIMKETIEQAKQDATSSQIVLQVEKISQDVVANVVSSNLEIKSSISKTLSSWRSFGVSILSGIISTFIFSIIALFLYLSVKFDPSLIAIARDKMDGNPPRQEKTSPSPPN